MNKLAIPAILVATVMVAGMFAFMPVEQASTVHTTVQGTQAQLITDTSNTLVELTAGDTAFTVTVTSAGNVAFTVDALYLEVSTGNTAAGELAADESISLGSISVGGDVVFNPSDFLVLTGVNAATATGVRTLANINDLATTDSTNVVRITSPGETVTFTFAQDVDSAQGDGSNRDGVDITAIVIGTVVGGAALTATVVD